MRKKLFVATSIALILLLALLLTGCGGGGGQRETGGTSQAPSGQAAGTGPAAGGESAGEGKPVKVIFATNPQGSGYYTIAVGQGQLVSKKTNINVVVQPTQGTKVNPDLVGAGEAQISNITANTGYSAYKGLEGFKPHPFMRVLQAGHSNLYGFVVRAEDNLKDIPALKGKRITYDYPGVSIIASLARLEFKAYGLDLEKDAGQLLKAESSTVGVQDVVEGKTDAAMSSIGGGKMMEAASVKPLAVVPFPESKADVVIKEMPAMVPEVASAADYPFLSEDTPVMGSVSLLWAHESLDETVAYTIVKTLVENYQELQPIHPDFKGWTPERAVRRVPIPYHPGAIKYYKEAGLWNEEMDKWQNELLSQN